MGIWHHRDTFTRPTLADLSREACPFCRRALQGWEVGGDEGALESEVSICITCGWWSRIEYHVSPELDEFNLDTDTLIINDRHTLEGACAQLENLDLTDISTPLSEARRYLLAKEAERFRMHPRLFELVVACVFRELGYRAVATAYHGDGGIDVVLQRGLSTIGVQVKRYGKRIEAEQIRSLAGALILEDHIEGVFVTTSSFRSGARTAAHRFTSKGLPIKLLDGRRFLQQLGMQETKKLTQRKIRDYVDEILLTGESTEIVDSP